MEVIIPKVIHYCWFGGNEKDSLTKNCIASWKKYCPDFEIMEWNESNYNFSSNKYAKEAYEQRKWAFVTDYVRLDVIYQYGGIYFDCDVELIKRIDGLLKYNAFFGFEETANINTGSGFGAKKGYYVIQELLNDYKDIPFVQENGELDVTPCPVRNTITLEKIGLIRNNELQIIDNSIFLPTVYLCPIDFITGKCNITDQTLSIHHYNGSWLNEKDKNKRTLYKLFVKIFGERISRMVKKAVLGISKI